MLAVLIPCTALAACRERTLDGGPYFDHAALSVTRLEGTPLNNAPAIGRPILIRVSDSTLWVADLSSNPGLHALDRASGELLFSVGKRGEGPGEFSTRPFGLELPFTGADGIWGWDMALQRVTRFERRPPSEYQPVTVRLQGQTRVQRIAWVNPNRIIGVANSEDARFSLFTGDGRFERVVAGPLPGPDSIARAFRLLAANGGIKVCTWPAQGFVIANFMIGRIEYYDMDAGFVRLANAPFQSEVELEADSTGRRALSAPRRWYFDCAATADHLFTLFSGRLDSAYEGDARESGEFIHVFDWTGELRAVFRLDRDIRGIGVSPQGDVLYATSLADAGIYRYRLPAITKPAIAKR